MKAEAEAMAEYSIGDIEPKRIERPVSKADVAAVLCAAAAAGESVLPVGCGARLHIGNTPRSYDVALSLRDLAGIEMHRVDDMTITVQAGMTLAEVNDALLPCGQYLPLDPAEPGKTTVGGLIAGDCSGPLRLSCGKVRDHLLGVEAVLGSGETLCAGGRVVKNVAGYDLCKVLAGSYGTLAVILSATFRTRPRPRYQVVLSVPCKDVAEAIAKAARIASGPITPLAMEALGAGLCEGLGIGGSAALVIVLGGNAGEVEFMRETLDADLGQSLDLLDGELLEQIRAFTLPSGWIGDDAVELVARIAMRPAELGDFIEAIEGEAAARRLSVELCAHAAVGVARSRVRSAGGDTNGLLLFAEWLRLNVRERSGWVIYEALPARLRNRVDVWGFAGSTLRLMRGIKDAFDPDNVFVRGRFVGGI